MNQRVLGLVGPPAEDRKLVLAFFTVFSRFEYALKTSGLVAEGRHREAAPDWNAFATELRGRFAAVHDKRFANACAYLRGAPPRRQVLIKGRLRWEDSHPRHGEYDERYLLRLVRTVRNNLFHGSKFPYGVGPDLDALRNRRLLEAGIAVLEQCLALSPKVRGAYV